MTTDGTYAPKDTPFREVDWIMHYSVGGKSFASSRFSFTSTGWRGNTRYLEEGAEIEVYYCPTDPSVAVARPGLRPNLLLGPLLLLLGLGFLFHELGTH